MPDIIQLLPDSLANQIAAGEVVQRPASVVKELLENSIDAGSTSVQLVLKEAGRMLIQVIDNGAGMSETDARMCFERHATSKLRTSADLFNIRTMGFRGEAMASIAAVAQVEMRTRQAAAEVGTRLVIEGSEIKTHEAIATPVGTNTMVKNLFFNVPARRNFLKSNIVEMRHVTDEFERVAMAHPNVQMSLTHNGTQLQHLPAGTLRQRIVGVWGKDHNKRIVPVSEETEVVRIDGFIGKPEFAKKTRGEQFFFVNDRFIKSSYLHHAVMDAFAELIARDAQPIYALYLTIDPAQIDINVHPTKQEIKFQDERLIYQYLKATIRYSLGQHSLAQTIDFEVENTFLNLENTVTPNTWHASAPLPKHTDDSHNTDPADAPAPAFTVNSRLNGGGGGGNNNALPRLPRDTPLEARNLQHWQKLYEGIEGSLPSGGTTTPTDDSNDDTYPNEEPMIVASRLGNGIGSVGNAHTIKHYRTETLVPTAVALLHQRYIVASTDDGGGNVGYMLLDTVATQERILYERYTAAFAAQTVTAQTVLFPQSVTLSSADAEGLNEMLPYLEPLGFDIRSLGTNTFAIYSTPAELTDWDAAATLGALSGAMLEQYKQQRKQTDASPVTDPANELTYSQHFEQELRRTLVVALARTTVATASRRRRDLSLAEMQHLIDTLFAYPHPDRSPFGKRCFVRHTLADL